MLARARFCWHPCRVNLLLCSVLALGFISYLPLVNLASRFEFIVSTSGSFV